MIMARELSEDKSRKLISSSVGDCDFFYTDSSSSREKSRKWIGPTGDCDYFLCTDVSSSSTPTIQTQFGNQIQTGFESNPEIFNLSTSMEMIGFSKQGNHHQLSGPSSSKTINESTTSDFHQQSFNNKQDFTTGISETSSDQNLMVGPDQSGPWQENRFLVDDSSLRCVFPCEGNERPSQGLSLSLSSTNPSSIGLQSFELRQTNHHPHQDGLFGKSENIQQQQMIQDGFLGKAANLHHQVHFQLRNSKYLAPVQELLNEFCSLGTKLNDSSKQKSHKNKQWEDDNGGSSSKNKALHSLEFMELQKRKTKLLSMLEEVERRYKIYCDQMKAVVSLFEGVAGAGAATVYSALASKAMSRHFRCLKDGILNQLQATRKAMGEKDPVAPGTTRGETPRLRILDQTLRQQRAYQQMTMMETHPWRPQRGLPERSVSVLRAWLFEHFLHPYPSDVDKHILARQTGLSRSQVSNWFINARVRLWKPMVEEMYVEETKLQEDLDNNNINMASTSEGIMDHLGETSRAGGHHLPPPRPEDQKPTPDQLVRIDSECLSSIVINPEKNDNRSNKALQNHNMQRQQNFGRIGESTFGTMELDFSSYNHHQSSAAGTLLYPNQDHHHANHGFNGSGSGGGGVGGVSLTLGLQQHGGSGVSLAFSPASQRSLFYPRDHVEGCDPTNEIDYSLLDGEGQNLPYRNLMGAQLLHDLA